MIRALGKRVVGDIIEIGRRLAAAKEIAGHGGWLPWIEREFGWSEDKAEKFMRIAKSPYSATARNLELDMRSLYALAAPSTPEEAREAMRLALLYPQADHGGARRKGSSSEIKLEISKARLSQARSVLAFSRELALAVRDGLYVAFAASTSALLAARATSRSSATAPLSR